MGTCESCGGTYRDTEEFCPDCDAIIGAPELGPRVGPPAFQPSLGRAVVGLVLNMVTIPGTGTLLCRQREGALQALAAAIGIGILTIGVDYAADGPRLAVAVFGGIWMFLVWIWGIATGIEIVNVAAAGQAAPAPSSPVDARGT